MTDSIARQTFDAATFFDAAFVGLESLEAKASAEYEVDRAAAGDLDFNQLVEVVQRQAAGIFDVDERQITVFHNTTAAVERVIQRICQELQYYSSTLLTTDFEYPGIIAHLDEAWPGRVALARVSPLLWRGEGELIDELLRRAILLTRPDVLYLSHIARASGYRVSDALIDFARAVNPRTLIVIDGAQAVGNVVVSAKFLQKVSFYLTSGHKWLCGRPALGLVYAQQEWAVADPAQGYSKRSGSGGTGSVEALGSLKRALADFESGIMTADRHERMMQIEAHNAGLARQLCGAISAVPGIYVVPARNDGWAFSGIVSVVASADVGAYLKKAGLKFSMLHQEPFRTEEGRRNPAPRFDIEFDKSNGYEPIVRLCELRNIVSAVPNHGVLRLSLHYYHSSRDVEQVARRIARASKRAVTSSSILNPRARIGISRRKRRR